MPAKASPGRRLNAPAAADSDFRFFVRPLRRAAALIMLFTIGLAASVKPAGAAEAVAVDLELVLAVDISRSMDFREQRLQRDGYVAAFRHPEVLSAIGAGALGRIAVTYVQWAGPDTHSVLVPWMVIANADDAEAFASKLAAAPILRERGTSISGGLSFSASLFADSGAHGDRRAIDVSGDGPNNTGLPVVPTRDQVVADGITINGLPVMLERVTGVGPFGIPNLDVYYEDCVIGGPGAFVLTVTQVSEFAEAIRRKLVLEIAGIRPARVIRVAAYRPPPRIDCLIGEKMRSRWLFQLRPANP